MTKLRRHGSLLLPTLLVAGVVAGCSSFESSITRSDGPVGLLQMVVEVPGTGSTSTSARAPDLNVVLQGGGDELQIQDVDIVVRQVQFRRDGAGECTDGTSPNEDDGDACAEVAVGPDVLPLPLDAGISQVGTASADSGSYGALEFEVHVTTGEDINVLESRPNILGASVRVTGGFNDTAFQQPITFAPSGQVNLVAGNSVTVQAGSAAALTVTVDVESWFRNEDGSLLNPEVAASDDSLRAVVHDRIMSSFSIRAGT